MRTATSLVSGLKNMINASRRSWRAEEARAAVERYTVLFNAHDPEQFDEIVAEDYKQHVPVLAQGLAGAKSAARALYKIFPDIHADIEHLVVESDLVAVRFSMSGTHSAPFLGFEATGTVIHFSSTDWWRVKNRKVVEHWDNLDIFSIFEQLRKASGLSRVHPATITE